MPRLLQKCCLLLLGGLIACSLQLFGLYGLHALQDDTARGARPAMPSAPPAPAPAPAPPVAPAHDSETAGLRQEVEQLRRKLAQATADTPPKTIAPLRKAVFAVMTITDDGYKKQNLLLNSLLMKCSADCHGSRMPFHVIFAGDGKTKGHGDLGSGNNESVLQVLRRFGWKVNDHTKDVAQTKKIYSPVYTREEAEKGERWWAHMHHQGGVLGDILKRKDGWATYLKFNAWDAVQYDRVLMADMDLIFTGNPDPLVDEIPASVRFMASLEKRYGHEGLNTHMMLLTPSAATADELRLRAELGEYIPYTNTEQDVLEQLFTPRLVATRGKKMQDVIPHVHFVFASCPQRHKLPQGWYPADCAQVIRMCNLSKTGYKDAWLKLKKCM